DLLKPRVGHRHLARVRLDGAERIVGSLCGRGSRQCVEKCRLANVGQANDAAFETHDDRSCGEADIWLRLWAKGRSIVKCKGLPGAWRRAPIRRPVQSALRTV